MLLTQFSLHKQSPFPLISELMLCVSLVLAATASTCLIHRLLWLACILKKKKKTGTVPPLCGISDVVVRVIPFPDDHTRSESHWQPSRDFFVQVMWVSCWPKRVMGTEAGGRIHFSSVLYCMFFCKPYSLEWMRHNVWIPHSLFDTSMVTNHLRSIAGSKELNNPGQLYGPKTTLNNLPDEICGARLK